MYTDMHLMLIYVRIVRRSHCWLCALVASHSYECTCLGLVQAGKVSQVCVEKFVIVARLSPLAPLSQFMATISVYSLLHGVLDITWVSRASYHNGSNIWNYASVPLWHNTKLRSSLHTYREWGVWANRRLNGSLTRSLISAQIMSFCSSSAVTKPIWHRNTNMYERIKELVPNDSIWT